MAFFAISTVLAVIASTNAGFIPATYQSSAKILDPTIIKTVDADYDHHPQYSFSYDVQDSTTGDFKSQHETRDGDIVHGSYSLLESDGTRRVVDYTADSQNGFNAVVHKEPAAQNFAAPIAAKLIQPAVAYHQSPIIKSSLQLPATTYAAAYAPAYDGSAHLTTQVFKKVPQPALSYGPPQTILKEATPAATYGAPSYTASYAQPLEKIATPVYSANAGYAASAVAKYAQHPYIAHVTYTTPLFSYSH